VEKFRAGGKIILKIDLKEIGWMGMDWIHMALANVNCAEGSSGSQKDG